MNALVIAAHPDDEVFGCGGAIARHVADGVSVDVVFMADGVTSRIMDDSRSRIDARNETAIEACRVLGTQPPRFLEFPDNRMDSVPLLEVVQALEMVVEDVKPFIVYTHHGGDLNVDHRITYQAVMTACRPQTGCPVREIFSYEVPSSTEWAPPYREDAFVPNHYIDISSTIKLKLKALSVYDAEMREFPHVRSYEAVQSLARYRGATVGMHAAEAFQVDRLLR